MCAYDTAAESLLAFIGREMDAAERLVNAGHRGQCSVTDFEHAECPRVNPRFQLTQKDRRRAINSECSSASDTNDLSLRA